MVNNNNNNNNNSLLELLQEDLFQVLPVPSLLYQLNFEHRICHGIQKITLSKHCKIGTVPFFDPPPIGLLGNTSICLEMLSVTKLNVASY